MRAVFSFIALLFIAGTVYGQDSGQTQRRLQRKETRTTTPDLYKERDTLVSMLKKRLALLSTPASGSLSGYFAEDARITGTDGQELAPADFQRSKPLPPYRDYRLRNLRIEENTATATEACVFTEPTSAGTAAADKKATVSTDLRKGADGRWLITRMRISSH